jgi:hypothetical protein
VGAFASEQREPGEPGEVLEVESHDIFLRW